MSINLKSFRYPHSKYAKISESVYDSAKSNGIIPRKTQSELEIWFELFFGELKLRDIANDRKPKAQLITSVRGNSSSLRKLFVIYFIM